MPDPREDTSRRELERQIQDLKREKIRIEDNIRRMESNQRRIFGDDGSRKGALASALLQQTTTAEPSRKRSRSNSSTKRVDDEDGEDGEDEGKAKDTERGEDDTPKDKEIFRRDREKDGRPSKPDARSRNLFGKLLGHLQSAKNRLENEKGWKSTELNQKAQQRIEQKLCKEKLSIQELRRRQFDQQKKEEEAKAAQIDKTIEEKEMLLLQRRLESHYSLMMNFIRTKAEPTIFYLPAKHTKDTEHMLEETRGAIKNKIASLKVQLQPITDLPEDGEAAMDPEDAARASAAAAAVAGSVVRAPAEGSKPAEDPPGHADDTAMQEGDADKHEGAGDEAEDKDDNEPVQAECEQEVLEENADDKKEADDAKSQERNASSEPEKKKRNASSEPEKKKRKTGKQKPPEHKEDADEGNVDDRTDPPMEKNEADEDGQNKSKDEGSGSE